jgi:Icc protein
MRVAHITDLHVERPARVAQLFSKRALGVANLYLLGRKSHFTDETVVAAVDAVARVAPDLVLCTGDLTATGTAQEFDAAEELLRPITGRFPFLVVPGNHDVYTPGGHLRFVERFGAWSNGGALPFVRHEGGVDFVAVSTARPDVLSRGLARPEDLARLDALLASGTAPAVIVQHYPLRDRSGAPYGPSSRSLTGARRLEDVLARHPRVAAVVHGHAHHGYRTTLPSGTLSLNPGASGYACLPEQGRTAHFNVYDVSDDGRLAVERWAFDGRAFAPEQGGAYASGG